MNNNPSRYMHPRTVGMVNYGPVTDYDYLGYDRSYSNSYSTAEAYPQTSGYTQYPNNHVQFQNSQAYPTVMNSMIGAQPPPPQPQQPQQHQQVYHMSSNASAMPFGPQYVTAPGPYGYRPVSAQGYAQAPPQQMFPRQQY